MFVILVNSDIKRSDFEKDIVDDLPTKTMNHRTNEVYEVTEEITEVVRPQPPPPPHPYPPPVPTAVPGYAYGRPPPPRPMPPPPVYPGYYNQTATMTTQSSIYQVTIEKSYKLEPDYSMSTLFTISAIYAWS